MEVENREDMIPSSCKQCPTVEVITGTYNGLSGWWGQHDERSVFATSGAELSGRLSELHNEYEALKAQVAALQADVDGLKGKPARKARAPQEAG